MTFCSEIYVETVLHIIHYCDILTTGSLLRYIAQTVSKSRGSKCYSCVCYTGTSLVGSKPYHHSLSEEHHTGMSQTSTVTTHAWVSENLCNSAIMGSVIFNSECTRNRLLAELHRTHWGNSQHSHRLSSWIGGGNPGIGKVHIGKREKGRKVKWRKGERQSTIPALLFSHFQPCQKQLNILTLAQIHDGCIFHFFRNFSFTRHCLVKAAGCLIPLCSYYYQRGVCFFCFWIFPDRVKPRWHQNAWQNVDISPGSATAYPTMCRDYKNTEYTKSICYTWRVISYTYIHTYLLTYFT